MVLPFRLHPVKVFYDYHNACADASTKHAAGDGGAACAGVGGAPAGACAVVIAAAAGGTLRSADQATWSYHGYAKITHRETEALSRR